MKLLARSIRRASRHDPGMWHIQWRPARQQLKCSDQSFTDRSFQLEFSFCSILDRAKRFVAVSGRMSNHFKIQTLVCTDRALAKLLSFIVFDRENRSSRVCEPIWTVRHATLHAHFERTTAPELLTLSGMKFLLLESSCVTLIRISGKTLDVHCLTHPLRDIAALGKPKYSRHFWVPEERYTVYCVLVYALICGAASSLQHLNISVKDLELLHQLESDEECIEPLQTFSSM